MNWIASNVSKEFCNDELTSKMNTCKYQDQFLMIFESDSLRAPSLRNKGIIFGWNVNHFYACFDTMITMINIRISKAVAELRFKWHYKYSRLVHLYLTIQKTAKMLVLFLRIGLESTSKNHHKREIKLSRDDRPD